MKKRGKCMTNAQQQPLKITNDYLTNTFNYTTGCKMSLTWQTDHLYVLTTKYILKFTDQMGISQMQTKFNR